MSSNNKNNNDIGEVFEIANVEVIKISDEISKNVFIRVIENDMLKKVPVILQNSKSIQEKIRRVTEEFYELKLEAEKIKTKEDEDGYKYNQNLEYLKNGNFSKVKFIKPIVLDQKIIYATKCKKNPKEEEENDFFDKPDPNQEIFSDKLENQKEQNKKINELYKKLSKNEINIVSFYTNYYKEIASYTNPPSEYLKHSPHFKKVKLSDYTDLFRFVIIPSSVQDNLISVLIDKQERSELSAGTQEFSGFRRIGIGPNIIPLTLPEKKQKVESFLDENLYGSNVVNKSITVSSGEQVYIVGLSYLPNEKLLRERSERSAGIQNPNSKEQNKYFEETKNKNSKNETNLSKSKIILFTEIKQNPNNELSNPKYINYLREILPNSNRIIENIINNYENSDKNLNIYTLNNELRKWGLSFQTIPIESWKKVKMIIENNSGKIIKRNLNLIPKKEFKIDVIQGNNLLNQSFFFSDVLKKEYNFSRILGTFTEIQRNNILFETYDNGNYYYIKNYEDLKSQIKVDSKLINENINEIEKKIKKIPTSENERNVKMLSIPEMEKLMNEQKNDDLNENRKIRILERNLRDNKELIKNQKNDEKEYRDYVDQGKTILFFNKKFNKYFKFFLKKKISKNKNDIVKELFIPNETPKIIQSLLNQINKINDYEERRELIFNIIRLDGILIGKYVYSLFLKQPLICGHWYYLMLIEKNNSITGKRTLTNDMFTIFGDVKEKDEIVCTVCGSTLDQPSYAEDMFIDQWGNPLLASEVQINEDRRVAYIHSLPANPYDSISSGIKDCNSSEFFGTYDRIARKRNLKINNPDGIKKAKLACDMINSISAKMDINLVPRQFMEIIIVCVKESAKISNLEAFYEEKLRELKIKKKFSEKKISILEKSQKFKNSVLKNYYRFFILRFGTLVLAHLLWHFRTSIPEYFPGSKTTTSCPFFGFEEEEGIQYILCLIKKLKLLRVRITVGIEKINEDIPIFRIEKNLRFWLNELTPNYRNALKRRDEFVRKNEQFRKSQGIKRDDLIKNPINWTQKELLKLPESKNIIKRLKESKGKQYEIFYSEVILEIRKRAHRYRDFLDDFIDKSPITEFMEIIVNCCEQLNEDDISYIDYFEEFNNQIVNNYDDLIRLQTIYTILNNKLMTTNFYMLSKNRLISILPSLPIKLLDLPNSFIKDAFNAFCHDGLTTGEYHEFENNDFPEIKRCLKCGWLAVDLEKTEFTREQFIKLMENVNSKSIQKPIEKKKIKMLNVVSLKRNATLKIINQNLEKLISKMSKNIRSGGKKMENQIRNFFNNLDNFDNFIPDNLEKDIGNPAKNKIILVTKRRKFAIQKIKTYINDLFRTNISRIRYGYKIKSITDDDINWIQKNKKEYWEKIFINRLEWIEPFLTESNKKIFKLFNFSFSINDINNINGVQNVYDINYKNIIRTSLFNSTDAINVLKNYFLQEMIKFLDLAGSGEPVVAEFYLKMIEKIELEKKIINMSEKDFDKWKDTLQEKSTLIRVKYFEIIKEEGVMFNAPYKNFIDQVFTGPFQDPILSTQENQNEEDESEKTEKEEFLKEEAVKKLGDQANEQSIQDFVDDQIEEDEINEELEKEIYDNHLKKEGEEIMDIGYDYGDQAQGIENEGDGFNDYSMNQVWDPVHEPDLVNNIINDI